MAKKILCKALKILRKFSFWKSFANKFYDYPPLSKGKKWVRGLNISFWYETEEMATFLFKPKTARFMAIHFLQFPAHLSWLINRLLLNRFENLTIYSSIHYALTFYNRSVNSLVLIYNPIELNRAQHLNELWYLQ